VPKQLFKSKFLIGAAIGSGSTALAAERGGADFLLALNAGRLRNMGAPSIACMLPIRSARRLTESFARDELLAQCRIPVLLGIDVWGPAVDPQGLAREVRDAGFAGVANFPSCMHYARPMQQILSRAGRGIEQEVAHLRAAQDLGMTSLFYCATRTQARLGADAGLDMILMNPGWNVGGALGHRLRSSLEEVATTAREIGRLVKRISPRSRFLLEGGPIATPEDLGRVIGLAPIDGYVGGSTIERTPMEASVADRVDGFRQAGKRSAALDGESTRLVNWARSFGFIGRSKAQIDFLRRLRVFAQGRHPVWLLLEPGQNPGPAIRSLTASRRHDDGATVVELDLAGEDPPARARHLLFGQRDAAPGRLPLLADEGIDCLVIQAPDRLAKASQRRLAEALEAGGFRAPSGRRTLAVAPRVILVSRRPAAAHLGVDPVAPPTLESALRERLSGSTIALPPLRARLDDLARLIDAEASATFGAALPRSAFSSASLQLLQAHLWPGNELELRRVVGGLLGQARNGPIQPDDLRPHLEAVQVPAAEPRSEKDRVVDALWRHGYNRTRAAQALGISRKTLYNKIRKFGLAG